MSLDIFCSNIRSSNEANADKGKEDEAEEEYNLADIAEGSVTSVRIKGFGKQLKPKKYSNKNVHYLIPND